MKFTKPLIAVAAIFLATTIASAQCAQGAACSNGAKIEPTVTIDKAWFMDLYPVDWGSANWIQKSGGTGTGSLNPQFIGAVHVQTNAGRWDVTVQSAQANLLLKGNDTLKAIGGTLTAPARARLFLYACLGNQPVTVTGSGASATTATSPCATAPANSLTGAGTTAGGRLDTIAATGATAIASIAKALGVATGIQQANMITSGGTDATQNQSVTLNYGEAGYPSATDDGPLTIPAKVANTAWIGIYAALYVSAAAANSPIIGVEKDDLTSPNGTYKNNLVFNLVAKY